MKKLLYFLVAVAAVSVAACSTKDDDPTTVWDDYAEWRETNVEWLEAQAALEDPQNPGTLFYTKVSPVWDPKAYILIHYFNDRAETANNSSPMYTSTFAASYIGRLYNDVPFDSSYNNVDGLFIGQCFAVIPGWVIALEDMHVGDTCQIVVPYEQGYGWKSMGKILPFSTLRFNMKLHGVPNYETKPL